MVDASLVAGAFVSGVVVGLIYGLAALGLSIIWGILRVVNLAHGALLVLGMYLVYLLTVKAHMPIPLSILAAVVAASGLGVVSYHLFVRRVLGGPELASLLSTFGLGMMIIGVLELVFGGIARTVPASTSAIVVGSTPIRYTQLVAATLSAAVALLVYYVIYHTWFGRAVRAIVMNAEAAALLGVNVPRVLTAAFTLGVVVAILAGSLLSLAYSFTPETGSRYELYSFAIVVLGGLGNPLGSLVGGVILGIAEQLTSTLLGGSWGPLVAFLVLLTVLIVRPTGLFSKL